MVNYEMIIKILSYWAFLFIQQEVFYIMFIIVFIILDYVKKYTTSNAFKDEIPYHWNNLDIPLEIAVESLDHNV